MGTGTSLDPVFVESGFDVSNSTIVAQIEDSESHGGEYIPPNMFLVAAFLLFWYQTGDGVDGKQARRTGNVKCRCEVRETKCQYYW